MGLQLLVIGLVVFYVSKSTLQASLARHSTIILVKEHGSVCAQKHYLHPLQIMQWISIYHSHEITQYLRAF